MKQLTILTFFLSVLVFTAKTQTLPTITPPTTDEYCPGVVYTFTVKILGTQPSVVQGTGSPIVMRQAYDINTNTNGETTFKFDGRFHDVNSRQAYTVYHKYLINQNLRDTSHHFTFIKIKSLFHWVNCSQVQINQPPIVAPRCQITNHPISFDNVRYGNPFDAPPCYGTITNYEYLLPAGWKIGANTSDGSNWIGGSNSVTVTSHLSTGHGGSIRIRPVNTACGSGLSPGQEGVISISRPRPPLSISGDDFICSGSKNYSISGTLPPGAMVCWSSSNTNVATVPSSNCGTSTTVNFVSSGIITLTATVTDCIETYPPVTKKILIGSVVEGHYQITSNSHNCPGCEYTLYNNNSPIWLPANQACQVSVYLTSPGIQSATWSRASNSFPFSWSTSGTYLVFTGVSGSTAYAQRNGIFNLSAQTACGTANGTYTWPVIVQGWGSFRITTSPNPASDLMTLDISEESPEVKELSNNENVFIEIYAFDQSRLIKQWKFKNDQNQFSLYS